VAGAAVGFVCDEIVDVEEAAPSEAFAQAVARDGGYGLVFEEGCDVVVLRVELPLCLGDECVFGQVWA